MLNIHFFALIGYATAICSTINVLNFFTSDFFHLDCLLSSTSYFILLSVVQLLFEQFYSVFYHNSMDNPILSQNKIRMVYRYNEKHFQHNHNFSPIFLWSKEKIKLVFRIYWLKWSIKSRIITKSFVNIKMQ